MSLPDDIPGRSLRTPSWPHQTPETRCDRPLFIVRNDPVDGDSAVTALTRPCATARATQNAQRCAVRSQYPRCRMNATTPS